MARAMYEAEFADHIRAGFEGHSPESWDTLAGQWREEFFTLARAALSAAEAQGWVLVPKVPTEAMTAAGWIDKEDVNPDDIWCAMVAAATPPQEDTDGR